MGNAEDTRRHDLSQLVLPGKKKKETGEVLKSKFHLFLANATSESTR